MILDLDELYKSAIKIIAVELKGQSISSKEDKLCIMEQDQDGKTPLDLAIESGRSDAVEILLDNGAKKQSGDKDSYNVFHHCSR